MECGTACEEDEGGRMVACELAAAEALAGMARCSAARGGASELRPQHAMEALFTSQDQPVVAEQVCNYAPMTITSPAKADKNVDHIPGQLCSPNRQSNPLMKFRRKLSEAEKEERKVRRIMANRESARQTIRRRQAMYVELTRKASDVFEENENLKKQKELMVEEYNSIKGRNEFLKTQLAEAKKVAAGETEEEPNSPEAEKFSSANASAPIFLHNQPSMVPCFWPPIIPSSEHSMGNAGPGAPLFVVPIPWLLPLLTHSGTNSHYCGKCLCSEARPSEDSNHLPSNQNMRAEAEGYNHMQNVCADDHIDRRGGMTLPLDRGVQCSVRQPPGAIVVPGLFTPVRPRESLEPPRSCQEDDTTDIRLVSAIENMRHGLLRTNQETIICSPKKAEDVYVATEARRRRKELMKLKNIHCK
ncbi:hypothetical protein C2S53_018727 [Perilla frutescens var. hirtella]|uniref:BZIP domain-containing protein n=1 Tax=Perilla frutescens var. hirtella TaxID=608512 RepID=A0AAD4J272_PERFH|nr:hypothetical protein C2S53_018727 [Perilla frutescens var. hirtella]